MRLLKASLRVIAAPFIFLGKILFARRTCPYGDPQCTGQSCPECFNDHAW